MNEENIKELLEYYFEESYQIVNQLESLILELEKDYSNKDIINEIFRNVHTLKGSSASMDFKEIAEFSHTLEDSFDYLRNLQNIKLNSEIIDIILESIDVLKKMVNSRNEGKIYDQNLENLIKKIQNIPSLIDVDTTKKEQKKEENKKLNVTSSDISITESEVEIFKNQLKPGFNIYKILVSFNEDDPMSVVGPLQVYSSLRDLGIILKTKPTLNEMNQDKFYDSSVYLVISNKSETVIKNFIDIPDIVKNIEINILNIDELNSIVTKIDKNVKVEIDKEKSISDKKVDTQINEKEESSTVENTKSPVDEGKEVSTKGTTILRVDSNRIDELLNLVSQIVINKAALIEYASKIIGQISSFDILSSDMAGLISYLNSVIETEGNDITLTRSQIVKILNLLDQTNLIVDSIKNSTNSLSNELQVYSRTINLLQEGVMKIRMVPIEQMLTRFPRIIRDLSKKLNKEVEMITEGQETELDKTIIEELTDPVMHILRNCMDHGIEEPEKREQKGKNRKGIIKITAKNEGNIIKITIEDDGAGIDIEKIRKKAIEKKLINENRILSQQDAYELIFAPGFSTAEKVSDVSGRGVGLDVVRKALEYLNGTVQVESELGKYTRFIIKIPLTLAIIQALLVYVSDEIYAIPISNIIETRRVTDNDIIKIEGKDAIKIREEFISVLYLNQVFNLPKDNSKNYNYLIVVGVADKKIGLVVDSLIGSQDIVIKPLKNAFTRIPAIAGSAILGNGAIALIIDINQLINTETRSEISELDIHS